MVKHSSNAAGTKFILTTAASTRRIVTTKANERVQGERPASGSQPPITPPPPVCNPNEWIFIAFNPCGGDSQSLGPVAAGTLVASPEFGFSDGDVRAGKLIGIFGTGAVITLLYGWDSGRDNYYRILNIICMVFFSFSNHSCSNWLYVGSIHISTSTVSYSLRSIKTIIFYAFEFMKRMV